MILFNNKLIIRFKVLVLYAGVVATVVNLHPDLVKWDVKNLITLICFIVIGLNNPAIGRLRRRKSDESRNTPPNTP